MRENNVIIIFKTCFYVIIRNLNHNVVCRMKSRSICEIFLLATNLEQDVGCQHFDHTDLILATKTLIDTVQNL